MKPYFIYSKHYDFLFSGIDRLHPFDTAKFSKAWQLFSSEHSADLADLWIEPQTPITDDDLLQAHTPPYLDSLKQSKTIAQVIEIAPARFIPNFMLQKRLIRPIKLATGGTVIAAEKALTENAVAMNFGGGFHHAFADHGEGFCFFADAALAIAHCRNKGLLDVDDKVLMIDLDAHRGNGFEAVTHSDSSVHMFDMYNFQVYPDLHSGNTDEYPYLVPLKFGTDSETYLNILHTEITPFLDTHQDARLVFYNAGNDILNSDPLGGLNVDYDAVIQRDRFIIDTLIQMNIPTVIMTSGGYTNDSHRIIADMAMHVYSLFKQRPNKPA